PAPIQKEPAPVLIPAPIPIPEKKTETPATPTPPVVARTPEARVVPGGVLPVESFHEEEYTVKQGDSFASISQRRYYSEGYASALRRQNEDDPLRGLPLKEKDGVLEPGQLISIPDLGLLEKRYPNMLPKQPAAPKKEPLTPPGAEGKLTPIPAAV